jgi:hypothetical protein
MKNFRKLMLFAAVFLCAEPVFSQKKWSIGLQTGATSASMKYANDNFEQQFDRKIWGANATAEVNYFFTKKLAVGSGLGWSQRGSRCMPGWIVIPETDLFTTIDYLEIPLNVKYLQPISSKFRLTGSIGGSYCNAFSVVEEVKNIVGEDWGESRRRFKPSEDPFKQFNTNDFSAQGSLGAEFLVGKHSAATAQFRYTYGFENYVKSAESKNRALDFRIGWNYYF